MDLRKPWFLLGRVLGVGAFATMALGTGLLVRDAYRLAAHPARAEGRVVASEDRVESGSEGASSEYRALTYEFRDAGGRAFRGTLNRPGRTATDERGERLAVVYDAADPATSRPEDGASPWAEFATTLVVGGLLDGVLAYVFVVLPAKPRRCLPPEVAPPPTVGRARVPAEAPFPGRAGRSEWIRLADDPGSAPGWWWRRFSSGGWPLAAALLALLLLAAALESNPLALLALAAYAALGIRACFLPGDGQRIAPLLPEPSPSERLWAWVAYERGAFSLGRDTLALVVVDGWLVAEGARSGFALRPEDVEYTLDVGPGELLLSLADADDVVRLHGMSAAAVAALRDWHRLTKPVKGRATLPPAEAHPRTLARWDGWRAFGLATALAPLALQASVGLPDALVWPLLAVSGSVALFSAGVRRHLGRPSPAAPSLARSRARRGARPAAT